MIPSWTKCIQILMLVTLNVSNCVRSSTLNNSSSKDSSSGAVFSVSRGRHRVSDRLNVCSRELEKVKTFTENAEGSKTMNCTMEVTSCNEGNGLKGSQCTCKPESPNFVASKRKCVSNGWLRKGRKVQVSRQGHSWATSKRDINYVMCSSNELKCLIKVPKYS